MSPKADLAGLLPRHTYMQTGVGCANHNDPNCLCDVVYDTPAPVLQRVRLPFTQLALDAVGDEFVTAANFVEWSAYLLGCNDWLHTQPAPVERPEYDDGYVERSHAFTKSLASKPKAFDAWALLGEDIQTKLRESYMAGLKWKQARSLVPPYITDSVLDHIRLAYHKRGYHWRRTNKTGETS